MNSKRYDPFEHIRYERRCAFRRRVIEEMSWIVPFALVVSGVIYSLSLI